MDEVTSMVDVVTKEHIWQLILDEQKRGCAILLSSHDISEVKKLCTKLVVLQKGSIIFSGSPHEVRNEYCRCTIQVDNAIQAKTILNETDCSYTHEGNDFSIVTQDITQMLKLLHELTKTVNIGSFSCEHPAFYARLPEWKLLQHHHRSHNELYQGALVFLPNILLDLHQPYSYRHLPA